MDIKNVDLLCVGQATYDLVFRVPAHPGPDEKMVAITMVRCGGGPAANAAVCAARLGGRAAFGGYLSRDEFGQRHYQELEEEVVSLEYVRRGEASSPLSVILVKPDGARSAVNHRAATEPLQPGDLDFTNCRPAVVLFDGLEPLISQPLVKSCKVSGVPTILDAGSVHAGTWSLATQVDYLVCSEKFARQYTGQEDIQRSLQDLSKLAPYVVITLGERGLIWKNNAGEGSLPAYPVKVLDTTGAGDAFHGALALALSRRINWEVALDFASKVAALTCTRLGARPALPTKEELEKAFP